MNFTVTYFENTKNFFMEVIFLLMFVINYNHTLYKEIQFHGVGTDHHFVFLILTDHLIVFIHSRYVIYKIYLVDVQM